VADKKVKLVTSYKNDDGATMYEFRCPYPTGCGENALDPEATPYRAFNLAEREWAVARGKQHLAEHESTADPNRDNELTPEMHEFRVALGIAAAAAPTVNPDDWEL
jgi:hypothetical protein